MSESDEPAELALPRTFCHTFSHGERIVLRPVRPSEGQTVKQPPACINLKERFGHHYRVAYEESYFADYGPNARIEDPWLMVVLCEHGEICPWGGTTLAACTNKAGAVAKRLRSLPSAKVAQDGDDGANVLFDVEHFAQIAEIIKPRKRRRMTEQQRRAAAERLRQYQFGIG